MKGFLLFIVILNALLGTPAVADFAKGLAAAERGDYTTALQEWEPIAEQGNVSAQSNLGAIYDQGLGITQDSSAAFKWFKLAAGNGNGYSRFILGEMYQQGRGVTRDYIRAHMWWNIAASEELPTGLELARREFVKIQKDMTPAEVSKAQQLARECVAKNYKDC